MSVIFIVLPLALLAAATAVGGFIWAARNGQFDDLTTPGVRTALADDEDMIDNSRSLDLHGKSQPRRPG